MTSLSVPYLQQTELNTFLLSLVFVSFVALLHKLRRGGGKSKPKPPPGPPKLPIIGNLHQLGKLPHRSFHALSKKYGPLMLLHLGSTKTLVVSSAEAAGEVMKTHDIVFSNRPKKTAADIFLYGGLDIGFSPYGEYWRQLKKISVVELLSLKRVQSFNFVREEEAASLVEKIRSACVAGDSVNITEMLMSIANNIISRCVLGQAYEGAKFGKLSRRIMQQFVDFSFGDVFPLLKWMDYVTGVVPKMKSTLREADVFLDQVIAEHRNLRKNGDHAKTDFVNIMLQLEENGMLDFQLSQDKFKAILMDMFVGGTDTTSTIMEWLMAELIKNANVMRKVQEEVRRVVGKKLKVEAEDLEEMNYLKCTIKETLRLHPPVPLLIPRESSTDVELEGYYIPRKTTVLVNVLAIQTDPKVWDKPEEFLPERFENNPLDFKGQDFQFIPFGGGRRVCPGITFGVASISLMIANLLYWFDWKTSEDLDMTESYGVSVNKKIPLHLLPTMYSP
uniref:Cytochrome p450 n=1 Tax=Croton stellatopilosus TaxID=431156 RepID=A0A3G2CK01_9ROSI|nr:cytochrome p450 [Croton stellatopilosus]